MLPTRLCSATRLYASRTARVSHGLLQHRLLATASIPRCSTLSTAPMLPAHVQQRFLSTASKPPGDALPPSDSKDDDKNKKPSRWEQFKTLFREHGIVFVAYYGTTWLGGFGVCWAGITVAVRVAYDPSKVSYETLLDAFFHSVDPTTKDRQFVDVGNQYRTAIYYYSDEQKEAAVRE